MEGSALIAAAYDQNQIVGMARLIWDGGVVALIHDVLVMPEYKTQEVEKEPVTQLLDFLRSKLRPGFGIQVDIKAWGHREEFYESLGFQLSTPEGRGSPMHICLTDQIELTDAKFEQCAFNTMGYLKSRNLHNFYQLRTLSASKILGIRQYSCAFFLEIASHLAKLH